MMFAEPRKRFRHILAGSVCVQPASVVDTVSSRIAAALGFEVTVLAGSISLQGHQPFHAAVKAALFADIAKQIGLQPE